MSSARPRATTTVDRQIQFISNLAVISFNANNITNAPFDINVGRGSVIHPFAEIDATKGPIHIGEYCVVSERCRIVHPGPASPNQPPSPMVIGNYNFFGPFCLIQAIKIGNGNVFHSSSSVGMLTEIGNFSTLAASCRVTHDTIVPDKVIVFGENNTWASRPNVDEEEEMDRCKQLSRFFRSTLKNH